MKIFVRFGGKEINKLSEETEKLLQGKENSIVIKEKNNM